MKYYVLSVFLYTLFSLAAAAQKIRLEQFKNLKPRNIGPAGMSGRITAIDAVVANPDIIYLGSASGGVWKTENGGHRWTPVFDDQPLQNIGSIAIQQSNPNVVWVGTGEGNPRNSMNLGDGIFRTLDAGKTWKRMGLEKTLCIHRVIVDPNNPNTVYAAAIGNPYSEHPERGVFKTTDGGETWTKILYVNDTTGCADLVMDPSNPNKLIAAMWQFRRQPWVLKSGGAGSGLYITIDGGKTWKKLDKEDGLPQGPLGRIGVAFSRNMPTRVYAQVEAAKNGFYRSDDGGFKWTLVNSEARQVTNRPFYYQEIYVDPKNENRVYNVHSQINLSEDGGRSFGMENIAAGIHVDHHALWIHPENPHFILIGNDGGIGISRDRGKNWVLDEKLPVGQFYHVNVDQEMPYNVMGGMQDNGSWLGPAYIWNAGGIRNYYWNNVGGGDGFDVIPDAEDGNWVYSMSQGGNLARVDRKTGLTWRIKPPSLDPRLNLRWNWNAALAQDPFDKKTIYYGSQYLHKSTNKGAAWEIISPDLTTNDTTKIKAFQNTGGLTLDITGAETHCTILTIAPSPKEPGLIWAGTDDGNVQLTRDGGKTWTSFRAKIPGMPAGCWIPQVRASQYNAAEAFVVANDYRRGDFKPYIFRTTDYGKTWTRLADENKLRGYSLSVLQDPEEPNLIFAGTENGLWVSLDNGASFEQWKNGYPSVSTYDLAIQEREADLVIATFGRSLWVLDDIRPLRKIASGKAPVLQNTLTVLSAPDAYKVQIKPVAGANLGSSGGIWSAENRGFGAMVSFFYKPSPGVTSPKSGQRGDTVTAKIYNSSNELIRTVRLAVDSGFNRQFWPLTEKGSRNPGDPKPAPNAPEPSGIIVMSGVYKIVMSTGNAADSVFVNVKDDPRIGDTKDIELAQQKLIDRLKITGDKLTAGTDRLGEAEDVCTKMLAQLRGLEGKEADTIRKATIKLQGEIKSIRELVTGKPIEQQGLSRNLFDTSIVAQFQLARQNIRQKHQLPGTQEEILAANAEKAMRTGIAKINDFFDEKWKAYRQLVEGTRLNLFRDYKPIE